MRSRTKILLAGTGALLGVAAAAAPALAQGGDAGLRTPAVQATATSMNAMMGSADMGTSGKEGMQRTHEEMMSSVPGMAVMMRQNPQMARLHEKMMGASGPSSVPAPR